MPDGSVRDIHCYVEVEYTGQLCPAHGYEEVYTVAGICWTAFTGQLCPPDGFVWNIHCYVEVEYTGQLCPAHGYVVVYFRHSFCSINPVLCSSMTSGSWITDRYVYVQ